MAVVLLKCIAVARILTMLRSNSWTMNEYLRPWKLVSFFMGMVWLFWGALTLDIPDWDIGVSIIMGVLAYITAPWSVRVIIQRKFKLFPLMIFTHRAMVLPKRAESTVLQVGDG
jgi:fatty-acid desaturase